MLDGKRILAVVPARGGSKGLPGKNIRPLQGKPLICWTLDSARRSLYIDKVFVSTDSAEIAAVCNNYGVDVPDLRPPELAQDSTPSVDVMLYTLDFLEKKGEAFDYLLLLEPTSPLRDDADLDRIIKLAVDHPEADGVISVGKVHTEHPLIVKKTGPDGYLCPYLEQKNEIFQRQQEDEALFPYGVGYLVKVDKFRLNKTVYMDCMVPYLIQRWQNYEIDDIYDCVCVEAIMKRRASGDE